LLEATLRLSTVTHHTSRREAAGRDTATAHYLSTLRDQLRHRLIALK
jgi:hypothetical protein